MFSSDEICLLLDSSKGKLLCPFWGWCCFKVPLVALRSLFAMIYWKMQCQIVGKVWCFISLNQNNLILHVILWVRCLYVLSKHTQNTGCKPKGSSWLFQHPVFWLLLCWPYKHQCWLSGKLIMWLCFTMSVYVFVCLGAGWGCMYMCRYTCFGTCVCTYFNCMGAETPSVAVTNVKKLNVI